MCVPYGNFEDGATPDGESEVIAYLWSDPRIVCGSDAHTELKAVALVFVMMWPVGMLGLFVFVLIYNRKELRGGQPLQSRFAKAVRCLTGGYAHYVHIYYDDNERRAMFILRLNLHGYPLQVQAVYYRLQVQAVYYPLQVQAGVVLVGGGGGNTAPCRLWLGGAHPAQVHLLPPHLLYRHLNPLPRCNGRRAAVQASRG